ncbi:MAG: LamG domain-containing protein, partial [Candidatus Thermoplasmatota archaeon]|nr:LamG domain-containing protein [Candidatus Thermoplasmatota archaeon]
PYWQNTQPLTITATIYDTGRNGLKNVTLYHRFSTDNSTWEAWTKWNNASNPDIDPWITCSWNFNFPNGTGYYEFYSIAADNTSNTELAPSVADAICCYLITNTPPVLTNETPKNASIDIELNPILSIQVNDSEGQLMNITWYWGIDSSCPNFIGTNNSVTNGTYYMTNDNNFSIKGQTYYWRVVVNDGNGGWTNNTFHFKTTSANKEIISKEKTAYSLEINADGTMLYGFINNTNVTTSVDTNWHHVVLTYDGITIKLYIDGKLKNSTTLIGNIPTNNNDLLIGKRLTGALDEIRVSAIARSKEWINTTYKMIISPESFITVEKEQNQQYTYLKIKIKNTGSTTIKTQDTTILINGTDKSFIKIQPYLYPLKETSIFINVSVAGSKRNKFITGNGITKYEGYS